MSKQICFDDNWKFFLGDLTPKSSTDSWGGAKARAYNFGATAFKLDDSKWRTVSVPHDFVMEGDYTRKYTENSDMQKIPEMESVDSRHFAGGSLEGGIAWYRKKFEIPAEYEGKRVYIFFDGVYRSSTVYLNEYFVGSYASGYSSFYYDITDFVNYGGDNVIAVRVDATGREGWWYEGGGIYRHVHLEIKDSISVEPYGVFVSAEADLDNLTSDVNIKTNISNKLFENKSITVKSEVLDADNIVVGHTETDINVAAWDCTSCEQQLVVDNVKLWDLETPYLYKLRTSIYSDGIKCDEDETSFGIRNIRFDNNSGFYLNGRKVKIKGLCCHHDHAGVGIGVPDSVQEYRIAQLKSMGTNGYRCAHHQPSPELLNICDRLGMLVFAETRRMSSAPDDIECLKTLVKVGRNHPCVFLWGIGNEEIFSQDRVETARTTQTMKMEVRKLDSTRPITSAVVCWNGEQRFDNAQGYIPITKNLDVMGFNYCKNAWDDYHQSVPEQPMIITEAASNSGTRGCYTTDESLGQYFILDSENVNKCESGIKALKKDIGEEQWKYFDERDYLSGIFLWTGIDYRGEPTPLAYPAVYSQFGIFDYCGFEKDNYYYYKSWWSDEDVLHIFPHWNFENMTGEKLTVYAYSNFDEVEIWVNGKSYGRKSVEKNWYLSWEDVVYEPGELTAKGYKNGEESKTISVKTTGLPYALKLDSYRSTIKNGETAIINISVVDENGQLVPTADNQILFTIDGVGEFLGTGNGNPGSHESDKVPVRRAFNGKCQLLVKASDVGEIKITAISTMLKKEEYIITVR